MLQEAASNSPKPVLLAEAWVRDAVRDGMCSGLTMAQREDGFYIHSAASPHSPLAGLAQGPGQRSEGSSDRQNSLPSGLEAMLCDSVSSAG